MKAEEEFMIMKKIGVMSGTTSHRVGKVLKDWGYRSHNGAPTKMALSKGMVEEHHPIEDKPWISQYTWHVKKTCQVLKMAGVFNPENN